MIKKLKIRFILSSMLAFLAVMTVLVGALNIVNYIQTEKKNDGMLSLLADSGGVIPGIQNKPNGEFSRPSAPSGITEAEPSADTGTAPPDDGTTVSDDAIVTDGKLTTDNANQSRRYPSDGKQQINGVQITPETQYQTRYFIVDVSPDGEFISTNLNHIAAITVDEADLYASEALAGGSDSGRVGIYKYLISHKEGHDSVVFLDCRDTIESRVKLLWTSLVIALCSLAAVLLLVALFSGRAIRPVAESFEKQKRFITDAGHEIKTPLAIISANAEVMEMTSGENEWLKSIKNQTARLTKLVNGLVMLSKMDEECPALVCADFSISDAVYDAAAPFETVAQCAGRGFEIVVEPKLTYHGDEGAIRQLTSILCDNAVKYSDDGGKIRLTLSARGKNIVLEVFNTCRTMERESLSHLFDRFYRADESRSRETGGYGIGLSVAKAVVEAHGGKISARTENEKSVYFTVIL